MASLEYAANFWISATWSEKYLPCRSGNEPSGIRKWVRIERGLLENRSIQFRMGQGRLYYAGGS